MVKTEEELIWESYVKEAVVPFNKRREIRKGLAKKHGRKELKPYTFGFDIEFSVPLDEDSIRGRLEYYEFHIEPHQHDYVEWIEERLDLDEPDYEDVDSWESDHPEPDQDDFTSNYDNVDSDDYEESYEYSDALTDAEEKDELEYEAAHAKWEQARDEAAEEISNYYSQREHYLENSGDEYIQHLIDTGGWKEYVNSDSGEIDYEIEYVQDEIRDVVEEYKSNMDKEEYEELYGDNDLMGWGVSEDEVRNYEVTSPVLTTKDIPMIVDVLNVIGNMGEANEGTSAHIHIGIPDDFDFFDLMVVYDLVDEERIQNLQPRRKLNYAALKTSFFRKVFYYLYRNNKDGDLVDFSDIKDLGMEKHMGVNISNVAGGIAKRKKGEKITGGLGKTIEFRYLSSEIFNGMNGIEDGINDFLEWIEYFMMLMKLAQRRNQFTIRGVSGGGDEPESIKLTRVNKDQFRFNTGRARMPYEKPSDLKQREGANNDFYEYVKKNEKIYKNSISNNFQEKYPAPDFKNMSKQEMDDWWLSTPAHAYQYLINERTYKGNEKYLERALDDYRVGGELLKLGMHHTVLPERLPKLEYVLMYKKPKGESEDVDKILMVIVMAKYLEWLNYNSVIESEQMVEFGMSYTGGERGAVNKRSFEENQKLFKEIIHNIKPKEQEDES